MVAALAMTAAVWVIGGVTVYCLVFEGESVRIRPFSVLMMFWPFLTLVALIYGVYCVISDRIKAMLAARREEG